MFGGDAFAERVSTSAARSQAEYVEMVYTLAGAYKLDYQTAKARFDRYHQSRPWPFRASFYQCMSGEGEGAAIMRGLNPEREGSQE